MTQSQRNRATLHASGRPRAEFILFMFLFAVVCLWRNKYTTVLVTVSLRHGGLAIVTQWHDQLHKYDR